MSADNGFILRNNAAGQFVLQEFSASADSYPNVEDAGPRNTFDTLIGAVSEFAMNPELYESEYGLSIHVNERGTMPAEIRKYARKSFPVDAIQVTADNMAAVAEWCQGTVQADDGRTTNYIKVKVHNPLTDRQTKAFAGDWVLYAGVGFKVYTNKAFEKSFEAVEMTQKGTGHKTVVHRSAEDGQFITAEEAEEHPATTVTESHYTREE